MCTHHTGAVTRYLPVGKTQSQRLPRLGDGRQQQLLARRERRNRVVDDGEHHVAPTYRRVGEKVPTPRQYLDDRLLSVSTYKTQLRYK